MTKFARQLSTAMRLVNKFGVAVTWINFPPADGPEPEYPSQGAGVEHPGTIIAFVPLSRESEFTYRNEIALAGGIQPKFFGYMAGGLPFTPTNGDQMETADGRVMTLVWQNVTGPDLTDIVYELAFV